ncbi:M20/M25/M40 family metallo-hydrolase [Azospirillum picis]|uniref:Acetylornithine deacetylase/succinyl-diaminopimelate desuccinylase-like protein n=1 Tax=Azospirillum picis TaxID=488438 RepID=A0ABU0MKC8_9PROT|nr:M20/M25/M40 family metallo-hydrolase [Azospirillum picis]MBP2299875.1 acetylornithine deacetylase/succinyl-diaminopimelate desuccinylase-like protein [Azospirillum picis]MDQ0533671.1 acetylornithine deacetylase/succinyl-diaminopimelate desuccinylase-like protein [Azospirillum picis]
MTDLSPALAIRLEEAVSARFDEETRFLAELVKVPSDNPPGDCAPHAARAADLLEAMGFTVERHPVPAELVHANGMASATNLVVRHRFGDGPVVAMNAHGDVVPPGEGWSSDPYGAEIRDGVMYGRGVAVSKSDFATYAFALRALMAAGAPLKGTVELHLTYDEEAGGEIGPKWLLEQGISRPDYAVSASFAYSVVTAHNGCLHLEVQVDGKSAHAARPDTGHDALEAATGILAALYAHRPALAERRSSVPGITSPSLTVGLIQGGINTNVVPDRVTFRLDRRMIPEETPAEVEAELRALIGQAAAGRDGIRVTVRRILLARPFRSVGDAPRLAGLFARHAEAVLGRPVGQNGIPLYTDARHYSEAGIPTILYGAGPRDLLEANGHRADEKLVLEDLRQATLVVARALAELLTAGEEGDHP